MNLKISFFGATRNVTGSRYLIETDDKRVLVDCGQHQEREFRHRDWESFPVPPQSLDAVLLTHAHLDHCGMIPRLAHYGCSCPIYCTRATAEIVSIVLLDSAEIQQEDAEYKKQRHKKEGRKGRYPEVPLYTVDDVRKCLTQFSPVDYGKPVSIGNNIEVIFHDAGHIFGSSMITVKIKQGNESRKFIFTGDMGRWDSPILCDPTTFREADYIVMESTYGNREHESREEAVDRIAEIINDTARAGGNIIIPTFAIERAQDLLYYLNKLILENRIPHLAIFLDSPMAVEVTRVFKRYPELYDKEMKQFVKDENSFFDSPRLFLVRTVAESKAINHIKGTIIVMAGSGMCTGGRIKHHLVTNISRKASTILFPGYQAEGTLGRYIVDGASSARILGKRYRIKARIEQIDGFSAHADVNELQKWLASLEKPPRRLFITHGEPEAAMNLAGLIRGKMAWQVSVPEYLEEAVLD
jgi:metallo-beta-lactamase family protein